MGVDQQPSIGETEAGGLQAGGQPGLHSKTRLRKLANKCMKNFETDLLVSLSIKKCRAGNTIYFFFLFERNSLL